MLNILAPNINDTTIDGLMSALAVAGHACIYVNKEKPVFDAFYETKPDVVITYAKEFVDRFEAPAKEFKTKCVVLKTANFGLEEVYGYTPRPAANLAQYGLGVPRPEYKSNFSYINIAKPNEVLNNFVEAFMWPNFDPFYLKIYGEQMPYSSYLGRVSIKEISDILSSTKIFLTLYNDLLLEACYHNCICIPFKSNPLLIPEDIFGRADNIDDLKEQITKASKDYKYHAIRSEIIPEWILNDNTYYHRAAEMLRLIGLTKESDECSLILKDIKK